MRVALGLKSHSGWAALVAIGVDRGAYYVVERSRIELIEDADPDWPGQPYHAAEGKPAAEASAIVERGIAQARRRAAGELQAAAKRLRDAQHTLVACAVLMPAPMPPWSVAEILAVHLRMHQAEGVMYPDALLRGAARNDLGALPVVEKQLRTLACETLDATPDELAQRITALGKTVGAPWGADQKSAALAAMFALRRSGVQ